MTNKLDKGSLIPHRSDLTTMIAVFVLVWLGIGCRFALTSDIENSAPQPTTGVEGDDSALRASPCAEALSQHVVCLNANKHAIEIMRADHLEAVTVIQDVRTGAVIAFAASQPSKLDVNTHVLPLSLSKLLLAASWWDNEQPDSTFDSSAGSANAQNPAFRSRVSVHEMLVGGSDSAGRQMAVALRHSVGTKVVLEDFKRYGFGLRADSAQEPELSNDLTSRLKAGLIARPAYVQLGDQTTDSEWADTLSIGETNMSVTALHVSRFLQAVGNNGVMFPLVAHESPDKNWSPSPRTDSNRTMKENTARRLQAAMRDTVQRGTATSIATVLESARWQIGGKTGSGPGAPIGPQSDGWFAGLIFDPKGNARFTVATFVRHGGRGGGNAAKISAELARFIINGNPAN